MTHHHVHRDHDDRKAELQHEHEQNLEALQEHASKTVSELDRKLVKLTSLIKEKEVYLDKAQSLLSTRYN